MQHIMFSLIYESLSQWKLFVFELFLNRCKQIKQVLTRLAASSGLHVACYIMWPLVLFHKRPTGLFYITKQEAA